jgi:predicted anti-sigma-YlaC factor YlaD
MLCSNIEEYSILNLENDLDKRSRELLARHIEKCDKCRLMYDLIRTNYHTEENVTDADIAVSENILDHIDKSRYPITGSKFRPFTLRRVILVSLVCTLLIFAAANAKTIVKTYHELVNSMFIDNRINLNINSVDLTGDLSNEKYVRSVFR